MMLGQNRRGDPGVAHRMVEGKQAACGITVWRVFEGDPAREVRCRRCFPRVAR